MESFRGFDHKYKYKIGGHSGDSEKLEFVKEGTGVRLLVGCTLASLSTCRLMNSRPTSLLKIFCLRFLKWCNWHGRSIPTFIFFLPIC